VRLIHVIPSVSQEASGPSYVVLRLCESLVEKGHELSLAALDFGQIQSPPSFLKTFQLGVGPRSLGRSPALSRWLETQVQSGSVDLIHNHSLWMMPNIYPGWATRRGRIPLVVSPHGTFSAWALNRSRWKKWFVWRLGQKSAISHAALFHATADSEYQDIRRAGFRQPVCIIPSGVDIPLIAPSRSDKSGPRRLLFLSRIHPVKGIENLLRAWAVIAPRFPDWVLDIVGPKHDDYALEMQRLATKMQVPRVAFVGPLYGEAKFKAYRDADLFVLPTFSENFGLAVAEALAAGTPAIVTKGAPWSGLNSEGAGQWIDSGLDPLIAALETLMQRSPEELSSMGSRGRQWMQRDFSWERIGAQMAESYHWLMSGQDAKSRPDWIVVK